MATDPFSGSGTLAAPWAQYLPTYTVTQGSGQAGPTTAAVSAGYYYAGAASGTPQTSEIEIVSSVAGAYWTASTNITGTGGSRSLYQFTLEAGHWYLSKVISGVGSDKADTAGTWTGPRTIKVTSETSGANLIIRGFIDGTEVASWTDTSPLSGGQPGFEIYPGGSTARYITAWTGGDNGGGGSIKRWTPQFQGGMRSLSGGMT